MTIQFRSFGDFLNKVGFTATDYQDGVSWAEAKAKNSALSERDHDSFIRLANIAGDSSEVDEADQKLLYSNPLVVANLVSDEYITTAFENSRSLDIHYGGQEMRQGPYNEHVPPTEHKRYITYVQFLLGHMMPDQIVNPDGGYGRQMSDLVQWCESVRPGLSKRDVDGDTLNRYTLQTLVFYGNHAQNKLVELDTLIARLEKKRDYLKANGSFEYFDESSEESIKAEMDGDSALAYALQYLGHLDGMASISSYENSFLEQGVGDIIKANFGGTGATYNADILTKVIDELKELRESLA